MKVWNNNKTKYAEKKLIISNNKNNNYNSNNNNLKVGQNHRLENKETLIWIRNRLGLLRIWGIQALHNKQFKTTTGRKQKQKQKKNGICNTCHGLLSQE